MSTRLFPAPIQAGPAARPVAVRKRPRAIKASAYESGMDPVGTARERYSVKFYLVGMIFIVFDVEIVFMYPWSVSFKTFLQNGGGLGSLAVISVFIAILFVGLIYDIKKGGLDWD
ncbi:MAG: NADH-quinone oxidoreductase subunit A [Bacteroidetes bacterium]|nr:NADH-quinone oxidoreductase subunit A [Bacteroidota bacterium]